MRTYGVLSNANLGIPNPPDTIKTFLVAAATPQASDWESTGSTAVTDAAAAGTQIVRFTGWSTAGTTPINFMVSLGSTRAAAPSSGSSVATFPNQPVMGSREFQVPGGSTGYSIAVLSSGYVFVEQWRK